MLWQKLAGFFTLEAIATYIALLFTVIIWIYQLHKSKQGRHVVCSQIRRFSHLLLSRQAREWVEVTYIGSDEQKPLKIDTLSQAVIDIKNDSDIDTLNNVKLVFRIPDAKVLRVWWEKAPDYIQDIYNVMLNYA
jgi:hypothetical protein